MECLLPFRPPGLQSMIAIILFLLFAAVPSSSTVSALESGHLKGPGIIIQYELPLENAAGKIADTYLEIKSEIEGKLATHIIFVPTVVLIHQHAVFRKMVMDDLTTAFALPGKNLIVMDYSKLDRTPYDLLDTMKHEVCHLLLHQDIAGQIIPRWLDEGVCQWVSGGVADIINPETKDILRQAVLSDALIPLRDLTSRFPQQSRGIILAYLESKSFVEFIVSEFGSNKLVAILQSMQKGIQVEQAVHENLSVTLDALEAQWRQNLKRKYSWPTYIADHFIWILFFAASLATFIGYLRFRRRLKNYRDEEEEDLFE